MTVARSVGDVLTEHVQFEIECIDRMYSNVYVPHLQFAAGLVGYVQRQLGLPIASTAPLAKITDAFSTAVHRFAKVNRVPWIDFVKGQRKDDVMHEQLEHFTATRVSCSSGGHRRKPPVPHRETPRRQRRFLPVDRQDHRAGNHFYFFCVDADFGPFFLKFCSYFPYNAKLCLNGNERAKRLAAKAGIGFTALDNGFATVDDVAAVQAICDELGPDEIDALLRKWLAILPHPFTAADRAAGYRYDLSVLQAEFSLTEMLDKPVWPDVLRTGHPRHSRYGRADQVTSSSTASPGRPAPARHRDGSGPGLSPPGSSRACTSTTSHHHQAVHKEGKALRTETTINDTRDFGIGKRLTNLPALREIGYTANRRLLRVQRLSHDPITGTDALAAITGTLTTTSGIRIPGLRFADQRTHALLSALLVFRCHPNGFTNKDLRTYTAQLRGLDPCTVTAGQMTYDLRRLKTRALITRIEGTHRYLVTDHGLDTAKFLTSSRTAYCAAASPNSPPRHPPRAVCYPLPPYTAPRSKTSPRQHNSRNETSTATTPLKHQRT